MADRGKVEDLPPEEQEKLDHSILEKTYLSDLHHDGAIVYSAVNHKYNYYPAKGWGDAGGLDDQLTFVLDGSSILAKDRKNPVMLQFDKTDDRYESFVQCRVEPGKQININAEFVHDSMQP